MKIFAVFGNPIKHSISPRLHNIALSEIGLDGVYVRYLLENGDELVKKFRSLELSGANITFPYKEIALSQCDVLDEIALKIGSINTIVLKNSQIYGYNTDVFGFMSAIKPFGKIKSALVIGAGGTAKAVAYGLWSEGIKVSILNRSKSRLDSFGDYDKFSWDSFKGGKFDLIINTTSVGLSDDSLPAPREILKQVLSGAKFAFDVIYNKPTPFLNFALSSGLICKNGSDMLLFQAVKALNIFYNGSLDESRIEISMRKAFVL